jgi:hypothetical protein
MGFQRFLISQVSHQRDCEHIESVSPKRKRGLGIFRGLERMAISMQGTGTIFYSLRMSLANNVDPWIIAVLIIFSREVWVEGTN